MKLIKLTVSLNETVDAGLREYCLDHGCNPGTLLEAVYDELIEPDFDLYPSLKDKLISRARGKTTQRRKR